MRKSLLLGILVVVLLAIAIINTACTKSDTYPALPEVESVDIKVDRPEPRVRHLTLPADADAIRDILLLYRQAKPVRQTIETTPDTCIILDLRDDREIVIWNLYNDALVKANIKQPDEEPTWITLESQALATYLEKARLKAGLEPSYRHPKDF